MSVEKVDTKEVGKLASETEECNGTPNDSTVCAKAGVTSFDLSKWKPTIRKRQRASLPKKLLFASGRNS
jgi:hypothetical protein